MKICIKGGSWKPAWSGETPWRLLYSWNARNWVPVRQEVEAFLPKKKGENHQRTDLLILVVVVIFLKVLIKRKSLRFYRFYVF